MDQGIDVQWRTDGERVGHVVALPIGDHRPMVDPQDHQVVIVTGDIEAAIGIGDQAMGTAPDILDVDACLETGDEVCNSGLAAIRFGEQGNDRIPLDGGQVGVTRMQRDKSSVPVSRWKLLVIVEVNTHGCRMARKQDRRPLHGGNAGRVGCRDR